MTTIALHKYLQKIEQLIEENELDEAINHCRHILQQHPRHVDTYRILAKACLEKGNHQDAVDLIQRVLSADPTDLVAHVALSIAFKGQSKIDQSIWHLERALDVEPYNTALREELVDLYVLKEAALPDSIAPSSAALARMYFNSGMYNAAIVELRHALAQEPERIDLKVTLAETLYWANQRVEAVSLSLEILDVLPNCIPVNAILAEIWLQTGRVTEAQTYLKRLQAMILPDKVRFDPETAVGRAFITRGAPLIPEQVAVEQFGDALLLEPEPETAVIAMVNSDWIEEFTMGDTAELPEEEVEIEEENGTGWLTEAALATGETFGTQPLVMPSDPLEAETDWFVDPGDDDESLEELLGDDGGDAQLDDWLTGLEAESPQESTDEPDTVGKTGFTGLLTGLLDSELEVVDETAVSPDLTDLFAGTDTLPEEDIKETAVPSGFTDLFTDVSESPIKEAPVLNLAELADLDLDQFLTGENDDSWPGEEAASTGDFFAEGLTALFSDMDSSEPAVADLPDEPEDVDLAEFLASDLDELAEMDEPDEPVEHTGYTQLFDHLSTDAFPEEPESLDSDWLIPTTGAPAPDLPEAVDKEEAPDWLAEVKKDAFEPVQIDPQLTADWLSEQRTQTEAASESGWLAELAGDEPEMDAVGESGWLAELAGDEPEMDVVDENGWLAELAGDTSETAAADSQPPDIPPIWVMGQKQSDQMFETPAPIDFAESVGFDTDELEESTAVPTWLLGGDKIGEETGAFDDSAPLADIKLPDSTQQRENPQKILAGEGLPDWLRQPESDELEEPAAVDPLQTDSMMSLVEKDLPDWLTGELPELEEPAAKTPDPLATDSMADLVSGDLPSWLLDDEPDVEARLIPEPDSELDLYKDDINIPDWLMADFSAGQDRMEVSVTGDRNERESTPPQEPEEVSEGLFEAGDDDDLGWLGELAASAEEPVEGMIPGEEDESTSYASRVAAGEGGAVDEPPTQVSMPDELPDYGAEDNTLDWLEGMRKPIFEPAEERLALDGPETEVEMDDVLAGVTGELNADLDWLDSLTEESASAMEAVDGGSDEFDSGTGWLDALTVAGDTGPLVELGSEPILPDFEDSLAALPEEPEDGLDWLSELEGSADAEESAIKDIQTDLGESADAALDWLKVASEEADESEIVEALEAGLPELIELESLETTEAPEDIEDAIGWLEELAAGQGVRLEELPGTADALATEPELAVIQEPADGSLDWLDGAADEIGVDDFEPEFGLDTDVSGILVPGAEIEDTAPEDIEDAMAWLEGLAARQGARLEELPSMADADRPAPDLADEVMPESPDASLEWLEELADETAGAADVAIDLGLESGDMEPVDASLDWLEAMPETEEEAAELADEEIEAALAVDIPDDMEDAMVWLDALAEEQGAKFEELPGVTDETAVPEFTEPAPDLFELEAEAEPAFDDMPANLDDAMGWLEDLAAEQDSPLEDLPTIAGVVDEELFGEPHPEIMPQVEPEAPVDELTEALDWLEQLALKDSRLPAGVPVQQTAVSDSEDELAEALDWLEQLAQHEEKPQKPAAGIVELADLTDEMPEDPDEALAWLQQVAAEQEQIKGVETPIESEDEFAIDLFETTGTDETVEPETMADVELAAPLEKSTEEEIEADFLAEMPDDPDAAMAWLEQLAARQGARLEELPTVSAADLPVVADKPEVEIERPADLAKPLADVFPDVLEDLPENEDATWLDDLMGMDEETAVETTPDAALDIVEREAAGLPEADLAELEVPEDMDDAMAWLEALAAQQGARLEELPTLSGTGQLSPELLDEMDEETAVISGLEEIMAPVEEAAVDEVVPTDFPDIDETSFIPDDDLAEDETYLSEGIEEDFPDWLDANTDSLEQMPGQTQWLRNLDEPDIEGWLDEEETTISSGYDRVIRSRFETQADKLFETGPLSSPAAITSDADLFDMPEDEIETTIFSLDDEALNAARQAVENGLFDNSLQTYQTLVDDGGGMMTLIADLETIAADHPEQPLFRHLLGDAYMRNGQLQKALDTYRVALDQI